MTLPGQHASHLTLSLNIKITTVIRKIIEEHYTMLVSINKEVCTLKDGL